LIAAKSFRRNHIQCRIIFGVTENRLLRSATLMEQNDTFGGFGFIGKDDLVVEIKIARFKQGNWSMPLRGLLAFLRVKMNR
jgi:hypothetical protein